MIYLSILMIIPGSGVFLWLFCYRTEKKKQTPRKTFVEVHFVPIARDRCGTSNLTSSLLWLRSHDQEAKAIAKAW